MRNDNLTELERLMIHEAMFELGIVPMETPDMDVSRVLKQLPEEEARKLKRKFRKLWRKLEKSNRRNSNALRDSRKEGKSPTRWERRNRRKMVWTEVKRKNVDPAVEKFRKDVGTSK